MRSSHAIFASLSLFFFIFTLDVLSFAFSGTPWTAFAKEEEKPSQEQVEKKNTEKKEEEKKEDDKKETDKKDVDKKDEKKEEPKPVTTAKPAIVVTPLPRWIKGPKIYFDSVESDARVQYDYKSARYTFLGVMGTWNKRSLEIAKILNTFSDDFRVRNISIVTIFSHDTKSTVLDFKKVTGAKFLMGLAPVQFVDDLQNPRVPTFWLMNNLGNTLFYSELPENKELESILRKLMMWTDF